MRKVFLFCGVVVGALTLSGCATPEVRTDPKVKSDLSFYADTKPEELVASQQTKPPEITETPPAVPASHPLTNKTMYTKPPQMMIDQTKEYSATIETDKGNIVVALTAEATPMTVNNFVFLAREKFYDGTIFHRTIRGFMIQGGDPNGTGAGGPGYTFADESFFGEYTRGTLAMANAGPDTNGSQFFIMHADSALPPNYTIFGQVMSGLDVVDKIAEAPTKPGGEGSSPITPVQIRHIEIMEK